ncbi:GTPase HflX [Limihaloglobus sulfuriphilus]|uniref:GTPase HflX n=1 Tax=Limihaloglobus sulfuriphilus TaxID=1851148 RepID=UPI0011BAA9D9|nr:GTPase HflX [Limihaloglobus sulfuriphilus]
MEKIRDQLQVAGERAVLVAAHPKTADYYNDDLAELTSLAKTAEVIIVDRFQQKIKEINPATYIGRGKAEMLAQRVQINRADMVIFDNDLSPNQIRELEAILEVKVLDRSELILDIFASTAQTRQAKLQVELAQLEYTYPRLTRMWSHLDSVAGAGGGTAAGAVGGVGTRGTGEKQLEIDRRLVNKRITDLKRELAVIEKRRERQIESRKNVYKACLVGYTNAGKSTFMNAVTNAGVFAEDRLFATLDTRTRKWKLDGTTEVLLSDTVGFVRHLPHQLVESFKATLAEAVNADLLLHIVDVSSDEVFEQIKSVNTVLKEIGCEKKKMLIILNKIDAIKNISVLEALTTIHPDAIPVSASRGEGIEPVIERITGFIRGESVTARIRIGVANGKLQSYLHANSEIVSQDYNDNYVDFVVRLGEKTLPVVQSMKPESVELVK